MIAIFLCQADDFSESKAIIQALNNNPDLRIERLKLKQQSYALKSTESESRPQLGISVPALYRKTENADTGFFKRPDETKTAGVEIDASKTIPGGGTISLGADEDVNLSFPDSTIYSTDFSVGISQPLAKGVGTYSSTYYNIYVQRQRYKKSLELFREGLAAELSDVRKKYWNWIASFALLDIRKKEMEYAEKELNYWQATFRLGQISAIDTLSASIELIRAKGSLARAEQSEKRSRRELAILLGMNEQELKYPETFEIEVSSISSFEKIIAEAMANDSRLKILEITQNSLKRQLKYEKNRLLPSLDLDFSYGIDRNGEKMFSDNYSNTSSATVSLVLGLDAFSYKDRYNKRETELDIKINDIERENEGRELEATISNLLDSWRADSLTHGLKGLEVEAAELRYNAMLKEDQLGIVDALDRIKVKNDLVKAKIEKLESATGLKMIEIAIDESTKNIFDKFKVVVK